ncbi:hypothetical protein B9Z55_008110 [Caenorhabditis nigoni]|uniref:C-type lectin domain-containing protein n=1 Tax=Caenorhabditis nigoni TaxID=1611254 RepID=A0A2G5VCQ4_9PELO|nr:hypothetical protein B9Z55_008110 [Caenorhabditis nigoni]
MNFSIFLICSLFSLGYYATQKSCPRGFELYKNKKCLIFAQTSLKHLEAEQQCRSYGGHLFTVNNAIDNRAINDLAANHGLAYIWMGMYCFGNQTNLCYLDDGSGPIKYSNFNPGFPRIDTERSGCVFMETFGNDIGRWSTSPCEWSGLWYLYPHPNCIHNYNGNCYYPSHELNIPVMNRTFYATESICHTHSMELLSIHSREEVDYIKFLYNGTDIKQVSLGAHAIVPDEFAWTDGTKFKYENFDPLSTAKGNCLTMNVDTDREDNGMWYQTICQTIQDFVCVRKAGKAIVGVEEEPMEVEDVEVEEVINPKFQMVKDSKTINLADASHCNTTLFLAPGTITSIDYPSQSPRSMLCTWKIAVLGAFRLGLYFTDFSVYEPVFVYSSNGTLLSFRQFDHDPFSVLAPSNMITITHDSVKDAQYQKRGFSATVLPF